MASIKVINKQTGRENRHLTYNLMKEIDKNLKITLPEKFRISIQ